MHDRNNDPSQIDTNSDPGLANGLPTEVDTGLQGTLATAPDRVDDIAEYAGTANFSVDFPDITANVDNSATAATTPDSSLEHGAETQETARIGEFFYDMIMASNKETDPVDSVDIGNRMLANIDQFDLNTEAGKQLVLLKAKRIESTREFIDTLNQSLQLSKEMAELGGLEGFSAKEVQEHYDNTREIEENIAQLTESLEMMEAGNEMEELLSTIESGEFEEMRAEAIGVRTEELLQMQSDRLNGLPVSETLIEIHQEMLREAQEFYSRLAELLRQRDSDMALG